MRNIPTTTILFFTFLTNPVFAIEFTPEYLHGEWCYLYMDVSNQKNKQNTNWNFKADGKLFAQPSRHSNKMQYQHNWKIVDDKLKIKPAFSSSPMEVKVVSDDRFTFKFYGWANIQRGQCK